MEVSISVDVMQLGAGSCPWPPRPGEPVPSVPPIGKTDGSPLRYGGFGAASCAHRQDNIVGDASKMERQRGLRRSRNRNAIFI